MNSHAFDFSMAAIIVATALGPHTSHAQSLEERVQDLERRVQELESKERGTPAASAPTRGDSNGWRSQANWRTLKRGMSQDEIRRVLGEPHRVDVLGPSLTIWYYNYPSGGRVNFNNRGALEGWSEPRR
jgi:hypothetical protein